MDKKKYLKSFETISHAGVSKSESSEAMMYAKSYNFKEAGEHLILAKDSLIKAHQLQTDLIVEECQGKGVSVDIILVHAQDHISMAQMMFEVANEVITLYSVIQELKGEIVK